MWDAVTTYKKGNLSPAWMHLSIASDLPRKISTQQKTESRNTRSIALLSATPCKMARAMVLFLLLRWVQGSCDDFLHWSHCMRNGSTAQKRERHSWAEQMVSSGTDISMTTCYIVGLPALTTLLLHVVDWRPKNVSRLWSTRKNNAMLMAWEG